VVCVDASFKFFGLRNFRILEVICRLQIYHFTSLDLPIVGQAGIGGMSSSVLIVLLAMAIPWVQAVAGAFVLS
jgi:hypothetical protein